MGLSKMLIETEHNFIKIPCFMWALKDEKGNVIRKGVLNSPNRVFLEEIIPDSKEIMDLSDIQTHLNVYHPGYKIAYHMEFLFLDEEEFE